MAQTRAAGQQPGTAAVSAVRQHLIDQAESQHADQRGRWDTWRVGQVRRDVRLRGLLAFRRGEAVLVSPSTFTPPAGGGVRPDRAFRSCYSPVTGADTSLPSAWVAVA